MKINVITLYEGHYHYGVAAMVNSLVHAGFKGNVSVYFKGDLPSWTRRLNRVDHNVFQINEVTLRFLTTEVKRHFGYHKPFAAWEELQRDPRCEGVIYVDPDVVFLAPWQFFEQWLDAGVALCLDVCFPYVSRNHPWRKVWADLLTRSTGDVVQVLEHYANGGFVGISRENSGFLQKWIAVTETFESDGGNTLQYEQARREMPIVTDQDLIATALMGWTGKTSFLGLEAMGFAGYYFCLSHDVGHPKPWIRPFVRQALRGIPQSPATSYYLKHANAPLAPYTAGRFWWKKLSFRCAQVISRVWSRN